MVPIPEGVERHEEEPENESYNYGDMAQVRTSLFSSLPYVYSFIKLARPLSHTCTTPYFLELLLPVNFLFVQLANSSNRAMEVAARLRENVSLASRSNHPILSGL